MLLAGDIGGTKTKLAIYSQDKGPRSPITEQTFASQDYDHLETIAQVFLERAGVHVDRACFGVAGPVIDNRVDVTNLPWVIDADTMKETLGVDSVILLNDLAAIANGVPFLQPDELHTLHEGTCDRLGAVAVLAPGTGLGEAFLTWDGERYQPQDSEGGHTDFAPTTPLPR
jgi:glucokinase